MSFPQKVWQTLSAINCNGQVEKKGNLSYLSWTWAWASLMEHFPASTYTVLEPTIHSDGTYTVNLSLTVSDGESSIERTMWLPVMDNRNNAVANPDARKISDTTMRCLVKAISLFGLGLYIFAGSDLPTAEVQAAGKPVSDAQGLVIGDLIEETGTDLAKVLQSYKVEHISQLDAKQANHLQGILEKRAGR